MKVQAKSGQILSEYGIAIAAVSVLAVVGLISFQGQIETMFLKFQVPKMAASVTTASNALSLTNGPSTAGGTNGNNALDGNMVTLSDGTKLDLGSYPSSVSRAVEATGVNGATEAMLGSLATLAKSLLDSGQITEAEANQLLNLSNLGHKIASVQEIMENSSNTYSDDINSFLHTPITFEGKSYENAYFLVSETIGYRGWSPGDQPEPTRESLATVGLPPTGWSPVSQAFVNEYNAIKSSGIMSKPEVANIVNGLVNEIAFLAEQSETQAFEVQASTVDPGAFNSLMVSVATNKDAAGICATGGGQDGGKACK